jgi:type II secretory pathway pseudopilin PulG
MRRSWTRGERASGTRGERASDAGFTLVEAAATLALISIIGGLVSTFAAGGMRAIEATRKAQAEASMALKVGAALRDAAGQVRIPYWERKASLRIADSSASVPYFRGDRASILELDWKGRSLAISKAGATESMSPAETLGVAPLLGASGELRGIVVALSVGGKSCAISARFGQAALSLGKE